MTLHSRPSLKQWRGEVIERIRTIKGSYVRLSAKSDDPLLGKALFPELREALPRTTGTQTFERLSKTPTKAPSRHRGNNSPEVATRYHHGSDTGRVQALHAPSWMRSRGFLSGQIWRVGSEQNPDSQLRLGGYIHQGIKALMMGSRW